MNKPYEFGILVGRFQTLHLGHCEMIREASELCSRTGIFIGSSQESHTEKNPFTYELREEMVRAVFGDSVEVYPLPDIGAGNNSKWGEYVLEQVRLKAGRLPDLLVSGKEERRTSWFEGDSGHGISELYVPKSIDISASEMRGFLINDDSDSWRKYVDVRLHGLYPRLRSEVLRSLGNTATRSL